MNILLKLLSLSFVLFLPIKFKGQVSRELLKEKYQLNLSEAGRTVVAATLDSATILFQGSETTNVTLFYFDDAENPGQLQFNATRRSQTLTFRKFVVLHQNGKKDTPFILLPHDRVILKVNPSGDITFEADNPARTEEINVFQAMVAKHGSVTGPFSRQLASKEKNLDKLFLLYQANLRKQTAFLEAYAQENPVRAELQEIYKNFVTHNYYYSLAEAILLYHPSVDAHHPVYASVFPYIRQQSLQAYHYPDFRKASFTFLYVLTRGYADEDRFEKLYAMTNAYFDSSYAKAYQYHLLKSSTYQKLANYDIKFNEYVKKYPHTDFTNYLKKDLALNRFSKESFIGTRLLEQPGKSVGLDSMIASKEGKVLYIDFWASWCEPCLRDFPDALKLKEAYQDSDIDFLYISMDKDKIGWVKGQERFPAVFTPYNSYLLLDNFKSPFAERHNIQFIPRYMLLNKKGEIVDANALAPGDPQLKEKLNELLAE